MFIRSLKHLVTETLGGKSFSRCRRGSLVAARRDEATVNAWDALKGVVWAALMRIREQQTQEGVAAGHMGFLHVLHAASGPLTPSELGERLTLTPATVTGALTTLEERGLVTRERSPKDRRAVLVAITPRGREVTKDWGDVVMGVLREIFAPLSETELADISSVLGRVAPPIHGPPPTLLAGMRHDAVRRSKKAAPARPIHARKVSGRSKQEKPR
jgi:DNA-binding MarR family transcriptional regulator